MMRFPASCRPTTVKKRDWPNQVLAPNMWRQLKALLHLQVHIEEVPESQPAHTETEPPPGFACSDLDELDKDD